MSVINKLRRLHNVDVKVEQEAILIFQHLKPRYLPGGGRLLDDLNAATERSTVTMDLSCLVFEIWQSDGQQTDGRRIWNLGGPAKNYSYNWDSPQLVRLHTYALLFIPTNRGYTYSAYLERVWSSPHNSACCMMCCTCRQPYNCITRITSKAI